MTASGQTRKSALVTAMSAFPPIATILRTSREVRFVPTGDIAVKLSFTSCVPHFPMPTQSAKTVVSPCLACHVTIAYPHVGFTRNYSAAGFAQGCTLLWIRRSNLRLSERVCAVHYSVGVQSIDLGVR
jgi:hypothetical protein